MAVTLDQLFQSLPRGLVEGLAERRGPAKRRLASVAGARRMLSVRSLAVAIS